MTTPITRVFLAFLILCSCTASGQIITTIAGGGTSGLGDGGPAIAAELDHPYCVALDAIGNIYIADADNNRIRKINASGIISTIAGTGTAGYNGDNIPATDAQLSSPHGVAVDGTGNIYIADDYNSRIRKINSSGIITTVAGITAYGFSGDGGPATNAELYGPLGIAIDRAGNLYIADDYNHRIRKVDVSGVITTIAGSSSTGGFGGDGGPATLAKLNHPYNICFDDADNVYFTDKGNRRVRKISSLGIITTIAGTGVASISGDGGPASEATFFDPVGISINNNIIYVSDGGNSIRKLIIDGVITTIAGSGVSGFSGDGNSPLLAQFKAPVGITVDAVGSLYIADWGNDRIRYVKNTVAIDDVAIFHPKLQVYPNPSLGTFNIGTNGTTLDAIPAIIMDITGNKVMQFIIPPNRPCQVHLNAPSGIYFIGATVEDRKVVEKILLLH